ncbi:uridine diphosphate glucose pyrophosphatase NUDT22-like isoform X2 [Trachemys scripta elegans]|uniref:uridine diphosphate glucose pyrophosphatase NUDT22-like isoform X2 n=1 Tax=Trachemys scripta elegans TaxID=31138 RepID=UPI001554C302|nr:uridine diphosphate glucose pyrophosphatase NUDT22-like isoform X2 [Trachemys scripta elegans]
MDPEISIMLQCPSPKGLAETEVRAELSPAYDRRQLPGGQAWIDAVWEARCRRSPWLFNGSKFRLHSAQLDGGSLTFRLGLTCYKDFLGTNRAGMARHLQQQGRQDFGDSQAYLAEPLGVGAMVHTTDDCFVFLRRSLKVGEAPGLVDIPGGHPEPQAVVGDVPEESIRLQDLPRQMVVKEIFNSILREIRDEVNLPLPTLSQPVLLGIARNQTSAGRASAEFYVRCSLTLEQVKQRYEIGGPEAQESTGIIFIKRENPDVRLSKALSYVLRHGAAQLGLEMGADGFVDVAALLSLPRFGGVSVADVRHVVETNEKRRFALRSHPSDGRLQIRANQGHSLQVSELELIPLLEPTALPQTMAHGTYLRHWPAICQGGLSRMGRNHIHLAPGLPGDGQVLSGMRQDCDVAIVINGPQALADGIKFYRSANGVILTPGDAEGLLPPQYFQRVLQLRPDRHLLPLK